MTPTPAGYLIAGVVPVGAGPERAQRGAMSRAAPARAGFQDAVPDRFNDPVAIGPDPGTAWWPTPQDNLVNFPPESAANYLALEYAPPGSAEILGLPGRPVRFNPAAVNLDGSAPSPAR